MLKGFMYPEFLKTLNRLKMTRSLRQSDPPHILMAGKLWRTLGLLDITFTNSVTKQLNK